MFSLLSLFDDIASTLDDVAVMTKTAIERTSVLMSDDLAVNAGVVTGTTSQRELPMVKAIFLGSLWNKLYAISGVFLLMMIYPPLLKIILFLGGLYLSFEGAHKVQQKIFQTTKTQQKKITSEKEKIKGAIRTDLVLSIEIILIAKQSLIGSYLNQILALVAVGLAASIIIYGLVAILVKVDDFGLSLITKGHKKLGVGLVNSMPVIMKALGIIGTLAMLMVGGGIFIHVLHLPLIMPEIVQSLLLALIVGALMLILNHFIVQKILNEKE
jgi:hypothetical protein